MCLDSALTSFPHWHWSPALNPLPGALQNHLPLNSLLPGGLTLSAMYSLLINRLFVIEMPHMTLNTIPTPYPSRPCLTNKIWNHWKCCMPSSFRKFCKTGKPPSWLLPWWGQFSLPHLYFDSEPVLACVKTRNLSVISSTRQNKDNGCKLERSVF